VRSTRNLLKFGDSLLVGELLQTILPDNPVSGVMNQKPPGVPGLEVFIRSQELNSFDIDIIHSVLITII